MSFFYLILLHPVFDIWNPHSEEHKSTIGEHSNVWNEHKNWLPSPDILKGKLIQILVNFWGLFFLESKNYHSVTLSWRGNGRCILCMSFDPFIDSSGVYICKSIVIDLWHGNYICKSEGIYLPYEYRIEIPVEFIYVNQ